MKRLILTGIAAALIANDEPPFEEAATPEAAAPATSDFVGRYDGSSLETAMGMEVRDDGTWAWGLSVGALDMRAKGTWTQKDGFIHLASDPKPVAPKFTWSGTQSPGTAPENTPFVLVVWARNGEPFQYANAQLTCANGRKFYGQVNADGYPAAQDLDSTIQPRAERDPRRSCDTPDSVVLKQSVHNIRSGPFKLKELGWKPGITVRFAFERNDMGVADFTGVTGHLEDGTLKLSGTQWPLEMRKFPPRKPPLPQ